MERLNIRTLLLELTRQCNLSCLHCFRGDSENKYMSPEMIEKLFKNIARINTLLLTGGEPFLAVDQLRKITEILNQDRMNIEELIAVTNGTVLSDEILNMLFVLKEKTNFQIRISSDKFHLLELQRNNLEYKKDKNIKLLKKYFNVVEMLPDEKVYVIDRRGRAQNLTQEDLDKINNYGNTKTKYVFGNDAILKKYDEIYKIPNIIDDNVVDGTLNIDVYGNITPTYYSFKDEDNNVYSNVRGNKTLKKAITNIRSVK